jgi:hypothetical protein
VLLLDDAQIQVLAADEDVMVGERWPNGAKRSATGKLTTGNDSGIDS